MRLVEVVLSTSAVHTPFFHIVHSAERSLAWGIESYVNSHFIILVTVVDAIFIDVLKASESNDVTILDPKKII
jgi:hypothetical protein